MTNQPEPFLAIHRTQRPMIVLATKGDAGAFLAEEEKLWAWASQPVESSHGNINSRVNRYRTDNWIPGFKQALEQNSDIFKESMRQRYEQDQMLCNLDLESHALQVLSDSDPVVAAVALATIHGEIPVNDLNFYRNSIRNRIGVAHGTALLAGIDTRILDGTNRKLMESRTAIDLEAQRMRALIDTQQTTGEQS